jgi:DNA invertase Pin-like site-specific DNA recombinase
MPRPPRGWSGVAYTEHVVSSAFRQRGKGIDTTTLAGNLQLHSLAAPAEFERTRSGGRARQSWPCAGPCP